MGKYAFVKYLGMTPKDIGDNNVAAVIKLQCSSCKHIYEIEETEYEVVEKKFLEPLENGLPITLDAKCPKCDIYLHPN